MDTEEVNAIVAQSEQLADPVPGGPLNRYRRRRAPGSRGQKPCAGRRSRIEATKAAVVYAEDPAGFDARRDGGAYAVHELYIKGREPTTALLSRSMIGHLIDAIREGWLLSGRGRGAPGYSGLLPDPRGGHVRHSARNRLVAPECSVRFVGLVRWT